MEGFELFGSIIRKFDLPRGANCDLHQPDKMNYSIPRPNTYRVKKTYIEESLNSREHGVAYTTSCKKLTALLFSGIFLDCSQVQLEDVGQYKPIQILHAMQKSTLGNIAYPFQFTKG